MTQQQIPFRVYLIRIDGTPAYVGQTSQQLAARLRSHKTSKKGGLRSHWADVIDSAVARAARITIEQLTTAGSEQEALRLEEEWTRHIRAAGYDIANRNIGGRYSDESRAAIGRATQQQTFAPGVGGIAATPVQNLDSGVVYPSVSEAARAIGRGQPTLTLAIKQGRRCAGFRFAKVTGRAANDNDNDAARATARAT